MSERPDVAGMADGMVAEITDRARRMVTVEALGQDVAITQAERAAVDLGIGSGITQTMLVLVEMGILPSAPGGLRP